MFRRYHRFNEVVAALSLAPCHQEYKHWDRYLIGVFIYFSDLSALFDGIESLIFPMSWQHTLIPALPPARTVFLEAPTPYLIGLLVEAKQDRQGKKNS
jgi:hypothetical protein